MVPTSPLFLMWSKIQNKIQKGDKTKIRTQQYIQLNIIPGLKKSNS